MIKIVEEAILNHEFSPSDSPGNPCASYCSRPYPEGCNWTLTQWIATVMWEVQPGM